MNKVLLAAFAALIALGALVAGCGSDDETTTDETVTLTKAEFIKQGDAICQKGNDQSEKEAEEFAEENDFTLEKASEEQIEEAIGEVLVPILNRQVEEIEALGAPEGEEEKVEEILTALEDASADVEEDPSRAFEGEPLKEAKRLAEDYGFKVCGE